MPNRGGHGEPPVQGLFIIAGGASSAMNETSERTYRPAGLRSSRNEGEKRVRMSFLEPNAIPGLERALLELMALFGLAAAGLLTLIFSSIVGIVRAVRRCRRGGYSLSAVVLGAIAMTISSSWLLYWVVDDVHHGSNPLNGLLLINFLVGLLPASWLMAAIRANAYHRRSQDLPRGRAIVR